ncbi:predicted protein [Uncinocarpus reesii 1704]|uniref:Indoleamine 2,3-dioxygenase n=1 Tax=Uncinocarpus reesii (strain UAMH 1704) TaxID=336963 RepID=C4JFW2_UNCRE|nr:uncharacterized protein UREG_01042 [Uncinocarpus reesii 1704]EEP76193.1 predicted protein [Uncinocarpus reesii 1704]
MDSRFFLLAAPVAVVAAILWRRRPKTVEASNPGNSWMIRDLAALKDRCEAAAALSKLVEEDGAGSWPPKADHNSWPTPLLPYKDIYLELAPLLPTPRPSLDSEVNDEKRARYRSLMRRLLSERINVPQVEDILATVETGNWESFPRDAYNGFYCCIAVLRHAYRWATIPVVKVAQSETVINFPAELDAPWPYLQRNFGVDADSGNNTSNVLLNFDVNGERIYKINVGLSEVIRSSEDVFFKMFYDLEVMAFPIYYDMVRAIISFEEKDKASCVRYLRHLNAMLRELLLIFYHNLNDSRVSRSVWLSHIQGFQGWGVGKTVDGEFVKYDGLSGNHVLAFQAIDSFLGMEPYLPEENLLRYIPANQRALCLMFKKCSFRPRLEEKDTQIKDEISKIAKQLRAFRAAHRTRVIPYLEQPAPERFTMTAGKSVLQGTLSEAIRFLDDMMLRRLKETM